MKRLIMILPLLAAALIFSAVGLADPGDHGKGNPKAKGHEKTKDNNKPASTKQMTFGPYTFENTDNGCQGTPWANLHETRTFRVKQNKDGTYRVTRTDKGTFTTIGGASPGNCPENKTKHGTVVKPGVTGKFHGTLRGTVTGTLNPTATCNTACGSDTSVFLTTVFGPSAQFSCFSNSTDCKFNYQYTAPAQSLLFHHWQDRGRGAGTMLNEVFRGDIANA
ncbi:MAG: hypothetical protein QOE36_1667 [Gaiellaceae bacterium]|jgi:hypothetical protein|nr:hypothetical protein [Gaiellaceae bacterium]